MKPAPCYHLCSEGTAEEILFKCSEDFIQGMNIVAIAVNNSHIRMLAFCLMSNHFHFVLQGEDVQINSFLETIHRCLYTRLGKVKDIDKKFFSSLKWHRHRITDRDYFKTAIAYVLNNPLKAGLEFRAEDYQWSSAMLYFMPAWLHRMLEASWTAVADMTKRHLREILHSKSVLKDDWMITDEGYVWPGSYVDFKIVELKFKTSDEFYKCLRYLKNNEYVKEMTLNKRVCIPDTELRAYIKFLAEEYYHVRSLRALTPAQRKQIAEMIERDLHCGEKQLFRLLGLTNIDVEQV